MEGLKACDPCFQAFFEIKINMTSAIRVQGLKKSYPVVKRYREILLHPFRRKWVRALNGIDLDVRPGECFCLLGPNGAGKTTLIKILSTLVLPDEGNAFVNGHDVSREPNKIKSSIGYAINDERSFYWRLTGRQNLDFFAALNGLHSAQKRKKIEEVLNLTGLQEAADLRFNTYSTGMRQMMAFARVLLNEPKILFVDEPTRSLDPQAAQKIRKFLREDMVGKQGRTVFWATHNLAEARDCAHELAVLDKGKIKAIGTVEVLTESGARSMEDVYALAVGREP